MLLASRAALRCTRLPRPAPLSSSRSLPFSSFSPLFIHPSYPSRLPPKPTKPIRTSRKTSTSDPDPPPRDLDSYALASRVRSLALSPPLQHAPHAGGLAPALELIKTAPKHAATVVVWNVLLNAIFQTKSTHIPAASGGTAAIEAWRVRKAYETWMDMKRRGVTPSARSYGTFLAGAAKAAKKLEAHGEVLSAELRGRVETVHKQWVQHCARVLDKADGLESGAASGLATADGQAGLDFDGDWTNAPDERSDGKLDTVGDLGPHPSNQFLAFLGASLGGAVASPASAANGPILLQQLLAVFDSLPPSPAPGAADDPLSPTGVSYTLVFTALKAALSSSSPFAAPSSTPPSLTEAFPPASALLSRALTLWDELLASPPRDLSSLRNPSSTTRPLPAVLPTALLSLFLVPPSASLPTPLWTRALDLAQLSFGFVPPARVADLAPPHPPTLAQPLARLDATALGTAMRVAISAGKAREGWTRSWWEQVREWPERFGVKGEDGWRGVASRENAEVVIKGCGIAGDVDGIEALLAHLSSPSSSSPPTVSTYALALFSLHRIGTLAALEASFRVFPSLLAHSASAGLSARRGEKDKGAAKGEVPRKEHAAAASSLLNAALATRDRGQVWRALKAVSGPFASPSSDSPAATPSPSAFSPALFPPPPPSSTPRPAPPRADDLSLCTALLSSLDRLLRAPPDKLLLDAPTTAALSAWEARLIAFGETAGAAGKGRGGAASEMARRRAALEARGRGVRSVRSPGQGQGSAAASAKPARADGLPMRRERRDRWWAQYRADTAEKEAEREVFEVDARGRSMAGREPWREERARGPRRERDGEREREREPRRERWAGADRREERPTRREPREREDRRFGGKRDGRGREAKYGRQGLGRSEQRGWDVGDLAGR
ncbi:hypothetical protein JCM10207_000351 [Rhodosporidiobolus poonsookiae]